MHAVVKAAPIWALDKMLRAHIKPKALLAALMFRFTVRVSRKRILLDFGKRASVAGAFSGRVNHRNRHIFREHQNRFLSCVCRRRRRLPTALFVPGKLIG